MRQRVKTISVIIATYKRPEKLRRCLEYLNKQKISLKEIEVIVADDDPDKSAHAAIKDHKSKYPNIDLLYIHAGFEQNSKARNLGVKQAHGDWVVFLDDDAIACDDWIKQLSIVIDKTKSVVVGGPIFPFFINKPDWFKEEYEVRSHGTKAKVLTTNQFLSAANIAVKKSVFLKVGGFNVNLGLANNKIGFGEEVDLQIRIRENFGNNSVFYDPLIRVKHETSVNKMRLAFLIKSRMIAGKYHEMIYKDKVSFFVSLLKATRALVFIFFNILFMCPIFKRSDKKWQSQFYERILPHFYEIGWFWSKI